MAATAIKAGASRRIGTGLSSSRLLTPAFALPLQRASPTASALRRATAGRGSPYLMQQVVKSRYEPARFAGQREDHVERQVLTPVTDERIDADDRHGSREKPRADRRVAAAMIRQDAGRDYVLRDRVEVADVLDGVRLVAAEPQDHLVLHAQIGCVDEEQNLWSLHEIHHPISKRRLIQAPTAPEDESAS